jgi:hypothetical protein
LHHCPNYFIKWRERERENLSTSAKKKVTTGDKLEKVDAKVAVVYCIPRKNKYWGRAALHEKKS